MIGQELEKKIERGDESPFFMSTNQFYNPDSGGYMLDMERVWVWNIYKKDLQKLGAKIIKSSLGGQIGHMDKTGWLFLISRDDYKRIKEDWKQQRLRNFTIKLRKWNFEKK